MRLLHHLFENNVQWAARQKKEQKDFFEKLSKQQNPEYLWIGCSDSRVPANEIVDLLPGEMFVHRNIANVVVHTDLNCLSVLQYAVDVLHVKHIIVTGHYGCGGIRAAMQNGKFGLIDNWLRHIQDIYQKHKSLVDDESAEEHRTNRLCELNVIEQVVNVCRTTIVQDAWERNQPLAVHGWIYGLTDGLLRDMEITIENHEQILPYYEKAVQRLGVR
ncbi:MAG: carbonate dehydratase [Bacteroidetes bacterium]|nr:carbonate dehydratase [Bacteroidota bacterium]